MSIPWPRSPTATAVCRKCGAGSPPAATVSISPAPHRGILPLPISSLRVSFPVLSNPANRKRGIGLTAERVRHGFGNAVSEQESRELYDAHSVASLCVLHKHEPAIQHADWIVRTRRALRDIELGPVADPFGGTRYMPDFVAPIPDEPLPNMEGELERVRATEPEVVRADIVDAYGDDPPPPWDAFLSKPREML